MERRLGRKSTGALLWPPSAAVPPSTAVPPKLQAAVSAAITTIATGTAAAAADSAEPGHAPEFKLRLNVRQEPRARWVLNQWLTTEMADCYSAALAAHLAQVGRSAKPPPPLVRLWGDYSGLVNGTQRGALEAALTRAILDAVYSGQGLPSGARRAGMHGRRCLQSRGATPPKYIPPLP